MADKRLDPEYQEMQFCFVTNRYVPAKKKKKGYRQPSEHQVKIAEEMGLSLSGRPRRCKIPANERLSNEALNKARLERGDKPIE